jgi:hypothetical protein
VCGYGCALALLLLVFARFLLKTGHLLLNEWMGQSFCLRFKKKMFPDLNVRLEEVKEDIHGGGGRYQFDNNGEGSSGGDW